MNMPLLLPFTKACALGNDFVMIDGAHLSLYDDLQALSIRLADRRYGIGCDQVVYWYETADPHFYKVDFFNADGSQAESCGNGTRCLARLLMQQRKTDKMQLQTPGGILSCQLLSNNEVAVTFPKPTYDLGINLDNHADLVTSNPVYVNMGNPHLVCFVNPKFDFKHWGPLLETYLYKINPSFPAHVNVGFASMVDEQTVSLNVWERGAGFTPACGTGACAAAVAAKARGLTYADITCVIQKGGTLKVQLLQNYVILEGEAYLTYEGSYPL